MSTHTVIVKYDNNRGKRYPFDVARAFVQGYEGKIIRRTTHRNSTETVVTDYWVAGHRYRLTETTDV